MVFSLGATACMANIGASRVVPGANDNLSAVGVLVALAHELAQEPPEGVRVILLSTGSEESFMEGMQGFGRRHFAELPRDSTEFVCLECVGSPQLCVVEGEGMLRMRDYPESLARGAGASGRRGGRRAVSADSAPSPPRMR